MDQMERLSLLERIRDWSGLCEELEKMVAQATGAEKAALHLRLGRLLSSKFLAGARALKHYQDAYKQNPALLSSLEEARAVYWDLGKLNMVHKLLVLERKAAQGRLAEDLLIELGDVHTDLGDVDAAAEAYRECISLGGEKAPLAEDRRVDLACDDGSWQERVSLLLRAAAAEATSSGKSECLLRAARIVRRFAPSEQEDMLARAYAADPTSRPVAALYEGILVEQGRGEAIERTQSELLAAVTDPSAHGALARLFGLRWALRHQNRDAGVRMFVEALRVDPAEEGPFNYLREVLGRQGGDFARVVDLGNEAAARAGDPDIAAAYEAQVGVVLFRDVGDLLRARPHFERVAKVFPTHPQLLAFEAQIGERLRREKDEEVPTARPSAVPTPIPPPFTQESPTKPSTRPDAEPTIATAQPLVEEVHDRPTALQVPPGDVAIDATAAKPPPVAEPPAPTASVAVPEHPVPVDAAPRSHAASAAATPTATGSSPLLEPGKLEELRALAAKQEAAKRFNEYVKTLLAIAAGVSDVSERIDYYTKAADLYVTKFANQAEAVKCFEQILALDPSHGAALAFLRGAYEKRRDWEKLIGLERREAFELPMGSERVQKLTDIARLATDKVKKPDVCIGLWKDVLEADDSNGEALAALSGLYERARDFVALAEVLSLQVDATPDASSKIALLAKLGALYGDKLGDDEGAISAWRSLLTYDPGDRRAQDALKRKYTALGRWDDLEVFYAESGKWDEFIRVLEQQEGKESDPSAKIKLLFKIANLWADKKQKLDRAARSYEKVLEVEPTNLEAAEALVPIYTQANSGKQLAQVLEVKLVHETEPFGRVNLLRELASLYELRTKEPERAFERFLAAFEIAPDEERSVVDLERVADVAGSWTRVVDGYEAAVRAARERKDTSLAVDLELRRGRALVEKLARIEDALTAYGNVYAEDPDNDAALSALTGLYRQTGRFADLLAIYEKKRDLALDPAERRDICLSIAKLYDGELAQPEKAAAAYREMLVDDPADRDALAALDALYLKLGREQEYIDTLRARIELEDESLHVDLKFRLGQALTAPLADHAAALQCYREVLELDPGHAGAKAALEALLESSEHAVEAARLLEPVFERAAESDKQIRALLILSAVEEDVAAKVELLRKVARIQSEGQGLFSDAFDTLARALREDPTNETSRNETEQAAASAERWDDLVALFAEVASALSDPLLARAFWLRVAAIEEGRESVDAAAAAYHRILAADASDEDVLLSLERLFVRTGRPTDLVSVLERKLELTSDPSLREELLVRIATLQDEALHNPSLAIAAYRRILENDPASPRGLLALDHLYTREQLWPELAGNLEQQLGAVTEPDQIITLTLRLASLRETRLEQTELAIEGYRAVLERDPSDGSALSALERLGAMPTYELLIADLLEPHYRARGDYANLIAVHEVQVRRSDDVSRKVELLHQIAQLYEDADQNYGKAFEALTRALAEDSSLEHTRRGLARLAELTSHFGALAEVFEAAATRTEDPLLAVDLYTLAASVREEQLGDVDGAIARNRTILELDPTQLPAVEALERLYRRGSRFEPLSLVLQQKADMVGDPQLQKEALFQAAIIEEEMLGRADAAIAVYRKVLHVDAEDMRALDALLRKYLDLSMWPELLEIYGRKVDLLSDVVEKKSLYFEVGAVYERELRDARQAIDTYEKILELDPTDLGALSRLDVLYEHTENWAELLSVLSREADLVAEPRAELSFRYRISELYETKLNDVARAVDLYREILSVDTTHPESRQALERIKAGSVEALAAATVLEPIYEAEGAYPELVRVLEVEVAHATDPFAHVDLLHRIARLYEEALQNLGAAFECYARALVVDSANEVTLATLERLAMLTGQWREVARLYDLELAKLGESPERFVELGLRLAQILEVEIEDWEASVRTYERVLVVEPDNVTALRTLDRLFVQHERYAQLIPVLERLADLGTSPDEVLELRFRQGEVYQHSLGNVDAAIATYRDIVAAAPEHDRAVGALEALFSAGTKQPEIAEILEPHYRAAGLWDRLAFVYEAQAGYAALPEERLAALYRLSELYEDKLGRVDLSLSSLGRALREFPLDARAEDDSFRLAASIDGGFEALANTYADILGTNQDGAVQRHAALKLAKVFEEHLSDVAKAEETYRYLLSIQPLEPSALTELDRIYSAVEAHSQLAAILEQRVQATTDNFELVELYARLGEVYETRLMDLDHAVVAYRRIFDELEPAHEGAILALARIYEARQAHSELDVVYERELKNARGDVAEAEIRAKIANLASEYLGQRERAIETWKVVLDLRGEDPEALSALERLYARGEEWGKLVDVLEREHDIAASDEDRVNLLTKRADILCRNLGRDDQALEDYQRILDIDYANLRALRSIAAIRRREDDANELVSALHQIVDRASAMLGTEELQEIYRELGRTYQRKLEQPFDAAESFRKLLELGPDFEAMDALEGIYRTEERWRDVIAIKALRAEHLPTIPERVEELRQVAALWAHEGEDPSQSRVPLERILQLSPADDHAFRELEQAHEAAERWDALIELYMARLDTRELAQEKAELFRRIARVSEEKLGDKGQALDALMNGLAEDFGDAVTTRYLEKMAHATGRWPEVIQTVQQWLTQQVDRDSKIRLCLHLAKWYGEDLGRTDYAAQYYREIHQLDPNNVPALRQYGNLFRKTANWQKLGETLNRAREVAVTDQDRKELLVELGELLDGPMQQTDMAIAYFQQALDIDDRFLAALENLERIYAGRNQAKELAETLHRKVLALSLPSEICSTKVRIASLYETALNAPARAADLYREALAVEPGHLPAIRGLARALEQTERWSELHDTLSTQLELVVTERDRIEVLLHLARIEEERFLKPDQATRKLEQALEIDPTSEEAYVALERCYRKMRSWLDLISTYDRHIAATVGRATKVELYARIAEIYADEVGESERAVDAYRNIVDLDETNLPALEALAKLYDKLGDAAAAIDCMSRVADLTPDMRQRVEAFYRIGKAIDEKLGDRVAAQERFEMALDLDATHIPTLVALRQIALDAEDYDRAAGYLDQEQSVTSSARARAKLLVELGQIRDKYLGDHPAALLAFEQAIEADPENEDAALPLLDEYLGSEQFQRAEPLADLLVRKAGKRERSEQQALQVKLGRIAFALEKDEKALRAYTAAHQLDLTDAEATRGLAEVSFRLKDWPQALTNFQKVLTSLSDDQSEDRVDVYFKLGRIKAEQGQAKQAIHNWEKALAVDTSHRPTLDALVDLYMAAKDYKQAIAYKRQILDNIFDGQQRFAMLIEIADVWNDLDKNPDKAVEALEEARDLVPDDTALLYKIIPLYQATSNWSKMIDTLQALSEAEVDPIRRSRVIYTMAQIYRDKEEDLDRAVQLFNQALDLNPQLLEAFERIDKIVTARKDWKNLAREYRNMLKRLATVADRDPKIEFTLWHGLGLIYRDRLKDPKTAVEAFKRATTVNPADLGERRILAELYEVTDNMDAAIAEYTTILQTDPTKPDAYRNLYGLYRKQHEYDKAWCMCAALSFLQRADEEEQAFFDDYRPRGPAQVKAPLDNELWFRHLTHKDEDLYVTKIFQFVLPAVLRVQQQMRPRPTLDPKYRQDASSTISLAQTFFWAAQVLQIPQIPELYIRGDQPGGLVSELAGDRPVSIAGQNVLTGFDPQSRIFLVGRHLAYYQGSRYLRTLYRATAQVKILLLAAMRMTRPDVAVPPEAEADVASTIAALAPFVQPTDRENLHRVVGSFLEAGARADIKRWMQAAELTACRAGLLLSADLEVARKMLQNEEHDAVDLTPAEKMRELLIFSVSSQYFALRKALGIAVGS